MGRSQETFGKKDREKKRLKKREEKAMRKKQRQDNATGGKFEDMIAYVDENGQLSDTPPDETKKKKIKAENISLDYTKAAVEETGPSTGKVTFFNQDKGYGFIKDSDTSDSYFVHINSVAGGEIAEGDKVEFELEKGPKGLVAINVKRQ